MWGKIIGSFAGFAMGGPFGALFGAAAGHAYDRIHEETPETQLPPRPDGTASLGYTYDGRGSEAARQTAFTIAVIVLGAKVAKVDGPVNRAEIDAFKEVFRVPPREARKVGRVYNSAKQNASDFEPYAQQMAILFRTRAGRARGPVGEPVLYRTGGRRHQTFGNDLSAARRRPVRSRCVARSSAFARCS